MNNLKTPITTHLENVLWGWFMKYSNKRIRDYVHKKIPFSFRNLIDSPLMRSGLYFSIIFNSYETSLF